jgi:hypothetical protein
VIDVANKRFLGDAKNRRFLVGQAATEMLLIIGFLFLLLIPLLTYVFGILSNDSWKMDSEQARAMALRLTNVANKIALAGEGTSTAESVFVPSSVKEIQAINNTLIFKVGTKELGTIDELAVADVPLVLDPTNDWTQVRGNYIVYMNLTGGAVWLSR